MEVGDEITQEEVPEGADIAAYTLRHQGPARMEAIKTVNAMKEEWGYGSTSLVIVYNATGVKLKLRSEYDSSGHCGKYPALQTIRNGKYMAWLHSKTTWALAGSIGALVYEIEGTEFDVYLGFCTPYVGDNGVHAEVRNSNHWPKDEGWDTMMGKFSTSTLRSSDEWGGKFKVEAVASNVTSPLMEFVVSRIG